MYIIEVPEHLRFQEWIVAPGQRLLLAKFVWRPHLDLVAVVGSATKWHFDEDTGDIYTEDENLAVFLRMKFA